ncbi:MAG: hypothetical protein ACOXZQ_01875 [Bacteroidales bacterium]
MDNASVIFMEFEYETNLDEASNDVRSMLSFVQATFRKMLKTLPSSSSTRA